MTARILLLGLAFAGALAFPALAADSKLASAVASPTRAGENTARDKYRHPEASLKFWGVKPGQTLIEIAPSNGYWTEILAPYEKATGGHYIAAEGKAGQMLPDKFADKGKYGDIAYTVFSRASGPLGRAGSADLVLTARNIHDWLWTPGFAEKGMADFFAVLKPGGILAVEDHRADPRPQIGDAHDGYVATAVDREHGKKGRLCAGGQFGDQRQPQGHKGSSLWRLDLTPSAAEFGERPADPKFDHSKYDAIGESDRMTLRFRKPG